jgi:hypothetical protein
MFHRSTAVLKVRIAAVAAFCLVTSSVALAQRGDQPPRRGGQEGQPQGRRGGDPSQFIDRMMQNDKDGDGKLSRDELPGQFADRIFQRADANEDGFLDRAELEQFAQSRSGRGQERPGDREGAPEMARPTFEGAMRQGGRALRALRGSAFDASSRKEDLRAIQEIQRSLLMAKAQFGEVPMSPKAKEKFGDDKAAYDKAFHSHLIKALAETLTLETAVIDGNSDDASASLTRLRDIQGEGHELYQQERPRRGGERGQRGGRGGRGGQDRP